ncbi:hypothetical protein MTP99_011968 [Tenebrio molitor]|nr:hypothetical protein MTP99_011968 [Tenebrio molitor]
MICAGILMEYKDEETDQRRKEREFLPGQTPRVVLAEQLAGEIRICDLHCLQITLITFVFPSARIFFRPTLESRAFLQLTRFRNPRTRIWKNSITN